ncbi:MAG: cupin [Dehalococcoidia bacterium]|nr:cupin [Dehalococcoidia bacterium]
MAKQQYIEPVGEERAGWHKDGESKEKSYTVRMTTAWERFLKEENLPIFKGIGIKDSRDLPRGDWPRVGGKGTYIQLLGTNNDTGMFVVEVPARGALNPQRHLFEERYIVLDGRGSVEVWKEGASAKTSFEWQQWSVFGVPLNANFRIINTASSPALLLAVNSAPRMINTFQNKSFIFDNYFNFEDRFGGNLEDFWKPGEDFEPQPVRGRAQITTNVIPDASTTYLPLDNNRGPGFRWVAPNMVGNTMIQGWIGEYPSGRYAKAHNHAAGAVLVCMRGKGYSFTWPKEEGGLTPWENGKGDLVRMQEYWPGGMISAAPGPANWFHQHFAFGKDPFRIFNYTGNMPGNPASGGGGGGFVEEGQLIRQHAEITDGGNAIPYHMEDPYIRKFFEQKLADEGASLNMPEEVYTAQGANITIMAD